MSIITHKLRLMLLMSIAVLVLGCTSFENEPKSISSSESIVDIKIGEVTRSGEFDQRAETEQISQNNCDGKSPFAFSVSRERTIEQSVELILQGQVDGGIEIAGKPLGVGAAGNIKAAIGVSYGQSSSKSISDSGGMEFTIEAGDFPVYTIVWREKWERGDISIEYDGDLVQVPYLYQTTARPELVSVQFNDCETAQSEENLDNKTPEGLPMNTRVPPIANTSVSASTPILPTNTSMTIDFAQQTIGVPLKQIGEPSGFSYQGSETQISCPSGWICTTHRPIDGKVYIIVGEEGVILEGVDAGTFRWLNGYPLSDKVHDNPPCRLLEAERAYANTTEVVPWNFNCP